MAETIFEAGFGGTFECVFDEDGALVSRERELGFAATMVSLALCPELPTRMIEAPKCPRFKKCELCPDKRSRSETTVILQGLGGTTSAIIDDISNGII